MESKSNQAQINFDAIPEPLKAEKRWVVWKLETRNGKQTKVPYQANYAYGVKRPASSTNPDTWHTFQTAQKGVILGYDGIGFVLGDGWCGIDIDNCVNDDGVISSRARAIIDMFDSYAEFSPSGKGIHIICKGLKPGSRSRRDDLGIEFYDSGRYFTATGDIVGDEVKPVKDCQQQIDNLYHDLFPPQPSSSATSPQRNSPSLDDQSIIDKAIGAKNGQKFAMLYHGNHSAYASPSEADLALCDLVAFWTQDPVQVDRIFRTSGLMREKWDQKHSGDGRTYGEMTVQKALDGNGQRYSEKRAQRVNFLGDEEPEIDESRIEKEASGRRDVPFDFRSIVPLDSWLSTYFDYVYPTTDAPNQFTISCGIAALSMACRNMFVRFGQSRIRPNVWLALIAPSSLYRKSTSISSARRIMEAAERGLIFPSQLSPEAFVRSLSGDIEDGKPYGAFIWQEVSSQLEAFENRSYLRGYREMLTDLYDCPPSYDRRTISEGLLEIENPFINIMTASTQDWLNQCLSEGNMKGGFLPRFIWVLAHKKDRHLSRPSIPDATLGEQLVDGFQTIESLFQGGMTVDEKAWDLFEEFDQAISKEAIEANEYEGLLSAFYTRLSTYVLKFSMIYQADLQFSQYPEFDDRIITPQAMEYAISYAQYLKGGITLLLDQMAYSEEMRNWQKVKSIIKEHPGVERSRLMRMSKLSRKWLDETLDTLISSHQVVMQKIRSKGKTEGRPKTIYWLVKEDEWDDS